jgi:hypothetical protein
MSDYTSGLRMPMMQYNLEESELYEAYSFTQVVTYLATIVGQGFGVWLLTASDSNFALVALINALSFFLSSLVLLKHHSQLTHAPIQANEKKQSLWKHFTTLYQEMSLVFKNVSDSSFTSLLLSILLINAMGGSIGAIYNFYLLEHQPFGLSYAQLLFLLQVLFVFASIAGSLTPNDYFGQKSIDSFILLDALAFIGIGLSNTLKFNLFVGVACLVFAAYITGKAMPKLDALLMAKLPADKLAQSNSFLSMVFSFSVPLGVISFSSLALYNMTLCWIIFGVVAVAAAIASGRLSRK